MPRTGRAPHSLAGWCSCSSPSSSAWLSGRTGCCSTPTRAMASPGRAQKILGSGDFKQPASESVLIQNSKLFPIGDRAFRSTIEDVVSRLSKVPGVTHIVSPLAPAVVSQGLVSKDRHSALVQFDVKGDADDAQDKVAPMLKAIDGVQAPACSPELRHRGVARFARPRRIMSSTNSVQRGPAQGRADPLACRSRSSSCSSRSARSSRRHCRDPRRLGGDRGARAQHHDHQPVFLATDSQTVAVGDRDDRDGGRDRLLALLPAARARGAGKGKTPHEALLRTAATSGQAVLISGATVLIAVAGMIVAGNAIFTTIAIGTMIVVFAAMVGVVDRVARAPASAGRQGRQGPYPPVREPRSGGKSSGARSSTGSSSARARRRARWRRPGCCWRCRPSPMHTKLPSLTDLPGPEDRADIRAHPDCVPGVADAGRDGRQGRQRQHARSSGGHTTSSASGRSRPVCCFHRSIPRSTATRRWRRWSSRSRATGTTPSRSTR